MKVVLCNLPVTLSTSNPKPRLAIVSLIHWMHKFDFDGDFYDIDMLHPSELEMHYYFRSEQPDVVGISAVVSGSYRHAKTIARIIRYECPDAWIVLGGNMAASANVLLRKTEVDICVEGDGEYPWIDMLKYIQSLNGWDDMELAKITGIAFLNRKGEMVFTGYADPIPKDEHTFPDYEILSTGRERYFTKGVDEYWFQQDERTFEKDRKPNIAMVWVAKGCVARCTFCQRACKGYHIFGLDKFDKYIVELKEKYDVQFLSVGDETFGSNKKHAYKVMEILKKHDMLWFCGGVRCTSFDLEDFKAMKEHGCTGVVFGVESGSQKILTVMEKNFKVEDVFNALMDADKAGITASLLFCVGMPGETDDTIIETGRYLGKICKYKGISPVNIVANVAYVIPLPGSPLYEYAQLMGVIGNSVDEEEKFLIHLSGKSVGKDRFINLSGMSTRRVLFWDFLIRYEAMRFFYKNPVKIKNKFVLIRTKLPLNRRVMRILWRPVTTLNDKMVHSKFVSKLPRFLVYGIMRNLTYLEYRVQVLFRHLIRYLGDEGRELAEHFDYQHKLKGCDPPSEIISVRKMNKKIRETIPPPSSLTERNQQILYLGR